MLSTEEPRVFNLTYSELIVITRNLCIVMQRDILDFSIFGITTLNITNLTTLCDNLESYRSDIEYEGDSMVRTEEKNALAEQVRDQVRFMSARADAAFGIDSAKYGTFRFEDLTRLTDSQLKDCFRRIIRVAEQYKTDLAAYGVTVASLGILTDLCDDFEAALTAQEQAVDARRLAAVERTRKANEIYSYITNYCNFGKKLYAKTNPGKYQDYVIYSSPSVPVLPAPTGIVFILSTMTIRWSAISEATSYAAEIAVNNGPFQEVFNGSANQFVFQPTEDGHFAVKVRARNSAGLSNYSNEYSFDYYSVLPAVNDLSLNMVGGSATMYQLSWSAVPSSTVYKLYKSEVDLGNPPGEYVYVSDITVLTYSGNAATGKRTWLIMRAINDTQISDFGNAVFVDVEAEPA